MTKNLHKITKDKPQITNTINKGNVFAWSLWEWGSGAFNNIITTYVFSVYLTKSVASNDTWGAQALGWGMGIGGLFVAILAPITGQRSDSGGKRKLWLGVNTTLSCIMTACGFFIAPREEFLFFGIALIVLANTFFQFAEVNNNALLLQVSSPMTLGKISGFGWGMGYIGGIISLLIALFGFVNIPENGHGWFGVTTDESLNIRSLCLFAALWFFLSMIPMLIKVSENSKENIIKEKISIIASYRQLILTVKNIYRKEPNILHFLISSALFRDGLAAIFQFGAILAVGTYGLSQRDVIVFAVVGNLVAALGAISAGWFDDIFGPKIVILVSLIFLIISGCILFLIKGIIGFWICALFMALFVGPTQSSSRTFLARLANTGNEGELFGLYATTGRAVSFLAPALFSSCIAIAIPFVGESEAQRWGIWGIILTLGLGLITLFKVKSPNKSLLR